MCRMNPSVVFLVSMLAIVYCGNICFAEDFPVRAPAAVKGTTVEMLDPDFWISRIDNPERVVMKIDEIESLNEKNAVRQIPSGHPYAENIAQIEKDGPIFNFADPLSLMSPFSTDLIKRRFQINNDRLLNGVFYDNWALPLTDEKKSEYINAVNLVNLPERATPKTAMIVRHTSVRLYPTAEPAYRMHGYLDDNNVTSLDIGMPVAVLHKSETGDYLFVLSPIAWGWIPAEDIAFGSSVSIKKYLSDKNFIITVCNRAPFYADESLEIFSGWLYLGERLNFESETADSYCISVPVREGDGSLGFKEAWLGKSDDINKGYLPYTQKNTIMTAFRILGRPYGWHDSWDERDCGGIMRVIFNCFGFRLPRYWSFEQLCSDHAEYVGDSDDVDAKSEKLTSMPEGITFTGTTGHIGLYLGHVDGIPYGIHQCGWNYKDGGLEYKMARVVVTDYVNIGFNMKSMQYFTPMVR
ncbi:SH3 domain-containing protein [Candidatus Latescibacterota bacterium]